MALPSLAKVMAPLVSAVVLGVMLARLAGVVSGMGGMAVRRMRVVRCLLVMVRLMMFGGFAVMLCGVFVMLRCGMVMLDDLVFGHDALHQVSGDCKSVAAARL